MSTDYAAAEELQKRGIRGVPTFMVGDDVVVGLDKAKVLQLVDHRLAVCEKCGQKMRVPINKGIIEVKCPKCEHKQNVNT